ncbi:hypothetical protein HYFRA_00002833 [Hymenoscyphus fraxineus]|uniref:Uncharacterized protein n=1 Tax=Hymenoscyphus fraxineus TaxID=746836 RepID=A0A9N9KMS1_9HELO|nr:hypothetical protein HYFRA_00002833 [Hymenoscyphus fraxineus]
MSWQRAINIARVFKRKDEIEEDDDESFYCIGLPQERNPSPVEGEEFAADNIPESKPLPDLPWESRHGGTPARPLRSVGRLSINTVSSAGTLNPRKTEVHVRAPRPSAPAPTPCLKNMSRKPSLHHGHSAERVAPENLPDFSLSSSKRQAARPLHSVRGMRIGEKSRISVGEGNRLKLKEICAGYLFEPESSEDEKELERMFPTPTENSSEINQEEVNLNRLKEARETITFPEDYLIEDLINDMEQSIELNALPENDLSSSEAVGKSTADEPEATSKTETQVEVQEKQEKVERCPSPVPSLEFEPMFPVTDYQRRLREETRIALIPTERRRAREREMARKKATDW